MIIYHGSTVLVEKPEIRISDSFLDFGTGFYTTTSEHQAERWAKIKMRRESKNIGYVSIYEFDFELAQKQAEIYHFTHADCGDNVIVINAAKATLSGNKMEQKYYRTHSGWIGGLKETKYRLLMQEKPELAMRVAVRGMMPRNTVTKDSLKRLHIYAGEQHIHEAQKPELVK